MSVLFDRKVEVLVGVPGQLGTLIRDQRISFNIAKTKRQHPNKAKVEIYNLSRDTAALFESDAARNRIQVFAGYGTPSLIYTGEIRKGRATTSLNGPDRITRIEASSGGSKYRSARLNKSFDGDVTMFKVIDEVAKAFNVRVTAELDDIEDIQLTQGFVANGPARDVLTTLGRSLGFDWWFDDNDELRIVAKDGTTNETAVLLTPDTGLIESPKKTNKGVSGIALLNPEIRAKRLIEIRSEQVQGFYVVQAVEHRGDSGFSREFYTKFEARTPPRPRPPTTQLETTTIGNVQIVKRSAGPGGATL